MERFDAIRIISDTLTESIVVVLLLSRYLVAQGGHALEAS